MNTLWASVLNNSLAQNMAKQPAAKVIPLPSLVVLSFTGPESAKFLQGQTSTDFREVEKGRVLPGAVCSLKGRVLFSFIAIPDGENILLILPADQLDAAFSHFKKYAIFSKTQLQDASTSIALAGICGTDTHAVDALIESMIGSVPAQGQASKNNDGEWAIRISTEHRYLLLLPASSLVTQWSALQEKFTVETENNWWAADIRDGFATVFSSSRDLFQPQELNYPALEAVSYNKGCYTGQEIVARLYFRGKLKQRLYRLTADTTDIPAIGSPVFSDGKSVGDIVMAAHTSQGKIELLAVVKNKTVQEGKLTLTDNGIALTILDLPYVLDADKEE
jgi:folate-binding protein YgfZ